MIPDGEEALLKAERERLRFDPWKLRVWRVSKGLTCQKLADACGLNGRSALEVSRWETYRTGVGQNLLGRIAMALDIPERSMLSDADEWEQNVSKYERWVAAKRPRLALWLQSN